MAEVKVQVLARVRVVVLDLAREVVRVVVLVMVPARVVWCTQLTLRLVRRVRFALRCM